jgi:hypothetical protein
VSATDAARNLDEAIARAPDDKAVDAAVRAAVAEGLRPDEAEHIARERRHGHDPGIGLSGPAAAPSWPPPDMRLVEDDRAPAPALDDDALPAGWEGWIAAEAEARACPRDYVAAGLIGAASAWIGNARRVAATADWNNEPAHLWLTLIGAPSTGKTPALRPMIDASRELERDAEPAWRETLAQYERDAEAATARDKTWREEVRTAADNGAGAYLDYAAGMLDRVTAGLALTQAEADAAMIARHLLATRPVCLNERSLYQTAGFAWARASERRTAALAVLDREGWIRRPSAGAQGRPRGDWQVSPRLAEVGS